MSNSPLTPPATMAELDHHHQHMRHVSSPSPIRTSEYIPGLGQSALSAVSSPTTDKHPKGKRKRTAYVYLMRSCCSMEPRTYTLLGFNINFNWPMMDVKQLTCYSSSISTKDKLILEEAYSINPKPDKQARLEIVNRVSLNEKEVQVCHLL